MPVVEIARAVIALGALALLVVVYLMVARLRARVSGLGTDEGGTA